MLLSPHLEAFFGSVEAFGFLHYILLLLIVFTMYCMPVRSWRNLLWISYLIAFLLLMHRICFVSRDLEFVLGAHLYNYHFSICGRDWCCDYPFFGARCSVLRTALMFGILALRLSKSCMLICIDLTIPTRGALGWQWFKVHHLHDILEVTHGLCLSCPANAVSSCVVSMVMSKL